MIFPILLILMGAAQLTAQAGRDKIAQGNQLYAEEKFDEANIQYQDALLDNPTSPVIQYNVGNVLYKKKDYKKAIEAYHKSLDSDDPLFQSKTYYNIGNTLYRHNKLLESILAYEKALKLNPEDADAKHNLEFVRNKLKENADKQKDQNQQQQQQEQQQQNQDQEKKDQEKQDQQEQKKNQEKKDQQEESQPQPQEKKEMSKEEAERLLEALKEDQKDMKKKQVKGKGRKRVEKDW